MHRGQLQLLRVGHPALLLLLQLLIVVAQPGAAGRCSGAPAAATHARGARAK